MLKIEAVDDIKQFVYSIDQYSDEEIYKNFNKILLFLTKHEYYVSAKHMTIFLIKRIKDLGLKEKLIRKYYVFPDRCVSWVHVMASISNLSEEEQIKLLGNLISNQAFAEVGSTLDIPENLKFGLELEYGNLSYCDLQMLFENGQIKTIMRTLGIPKNIISELCNNSVFPDEKISDYSKWVFTKELEDVDPEISTPVLHNDLDSLNKVKAVSLLFKALKAMMHSSTGLHINVGVDYLGYNIETIKFLLKIWAECEEIFFKIANEKGVTIRDSVDVMAEPMKAQIQKAFDCNLNFDFTVNESLAWFIYNIQVRDRLEDVLSANKFSDLRYEARYNARNSRERFGIFLRYLETKTKYESKERFTCINFNHMNWGRSDSDRIEFRLFNNSLNFDTITEDLLLVGKLFKTCFELANGNGKMDKFSALLDCNVTEEQKLELLLDLLFDNEEEKAIFRERWESVKDNSKYDQFYTGRRTFVRI